jgi:hypothetical protein
MMLLAIIIVRLIRIHGHDFLENGQGLVLHVETNVLNIDSSALGVGNTPADNTGNNEGGTVLIDDL